MADSADGQRHDWIWVLGSDPVVNGRICVAYPIERDEPTAVFRVEVNTEPGRTVWLVRFPDRRRVLADGVMYIAYQVVEEQTAKGYLETGRFETR